MRPLTVALSLLLLGFTFAPKRAVALLPGPYHRLVTTSPETPPLRLKRQPIPLPKKEPKPASSPQVTPAPAPSPTPTPVPVSTPSYSQGSVQDMICSYSWDCATALQIAECESGFSASAVNGQFYGIFQMGSSERAAYGGSSSSAAEQIAAAFRYYSAVGWSPWACA